MSIFDISKVSRNSYVTDLANSIDKQIVKTKENLGNIQNSMIIISDLKTIERWEDFFSLSNATEQGLKERRERVLSFFNSRGFFTESFLKEQAFFFSNSEIEIEQNYKDYSFNVKFIGEVGIPVNLKNFSDSVNINKPCKLSWTMSFKFRTWEVLKAKKWTELTAFTWEEVHSKPNI